MLIYHFRSDPTVHKVSSKRALVLAKWGYRIVCIADCPGVEKVADPHACIRQKLAIVVGDPELAKQLQVTNFDKTEIEELLNWLAGQQTVSRGGPAPLCPIRSPNTGTGVVHVPSKRGGADIALQQTTRDGQQRLATTRGGPRPAGGEAQDAYPARHM